MQKGKAMLMRLQKRSTFIMMTISVSQTQFHGGKSGKKMAQFT